MKEVLGMQDPKATHPPHRTHPRHLSRLISVTFENLVVRTIHKPQRGAKDHPSKYRSAFGRMKKNETDKKQNIPPTHQQAERGYLPGNQDIIVVVDTVLQYRKQAPLLCCKRFCPVQFIGTFDTVVVKGER